MKIYWCWVSLAIKQLLYAESYLFARPWMYTHYQDIPALALNVLENTNCRLCNCTVDFLCASYEKLHWQCQVMQCEASAMHTESVLQICTVTVELTGNIDIIGDTQYCMCIRVGR